MRRGEAAVDVWPAFTDFVVSTVFILIVVIFGLLFSMLVQSHLRHVQEAMRARSVEDILRDRQRDVRLALQRAKAQGGMGLSAGQVTEEGSIQHIVLQDAEGGGILFEKGQATLHPAGMRLLDRLAHILIRHKGWFRSIQVEGHTDDDPIASAAYASNWELSAARAGAVVHYLLGKQRNGVPLIEPWMITASGRAEYHPFGVSPDQMRLAEMRNPRDGPNLAYIVSANADLAHQAANRRIELQLIYREAGEAELRK
jgi:flagellar motor protein MotB